MLLRTGTNKRNPSFTKVHPLLGEAPDLVLFLDQPVALELSED